MMSCELSSAFYKHSEAVKKTVEFVEKSAPANLD
jgi:hypothetical protein